MDSSTKSFTSARHELFFVNYSNVVTNRVIRGKMRRLSEYSTLAMPGIRE